MSALVKYLGAPYVEGKNDCYSVLRQYFRDQWGVWLPNIARPNNFWDDPKMDFYGAYRLYGFKPVFDQPLEIGDVLIMPLNTKMNTHAAAVVEGNQILHHMPGGRSTLDPLFPKWVNRANAVLRHPKVTKKQEQAFEAVHLHEVIDASILRDPRAQSIIERAMEAEQREMRGDH